MKRKKETLFAYPLEYHTRMANAVWEAFEDDDAVALEAALKKCGNPNVILINGENPLACQAARLCRRNVLRAALRWDGWAATAADKELRTPLHYAALAGDMESAQTLLELKPDRVRDEMLIKQQDSAKMTSLHAAVVSGNEQLVLFLLQAGGGAAISMENKGELSPVHMACSKGMAAAIEAMCNLESGKEAFTHIGPDGASLLHHATMEGHDEVVRVLLRCGRCNPNIQDRGGNTALHLAYALGLSEIVEILLPVTDAGLVDSQGKRAVDWCMVLEDDQPTPALVRVSISVQADGSANLRIARNPG